MFKRCKMLKKHKKRAKSLAQDFRKYISRIPVYGVILLNKKLTKCLMVTPYGGTSWTFPKGKVNEGESPLDCAVREVYEEAGFSCSDMMREDLYIEWTDKNGQAHEALLQLAPQRRLRSSRVFARKLGISSGTRLRCFLRPTMDKGPSTDTTACALRARKLLK